MYSSLTSSSTSSDTSVSETSSSSSSSDSKKRNVINQRKRKVKKTKQRNEKIKRNLKSSHTRFEVIPGKSKNAWDLPESMLAYVIEHFEKYIKKSDIQEIILDDNPVPENMEGPREQLIWPKI